MKWFFHFQVMLLNIYSHLFLKCLPKSVVCRTGQPAVTIMLFVVSYKCFVAHIMFLMIMCNKVREQQTCYFQLKP